MKPHNFLPKLLKSIQTIFLAIGIAAVVLAFILLIYLTISFKNNADSLAKEKQTLQSTLTTTSVLYNKLKSEDQLIRNDALQLEITNIQTTYAEAVSAYELLLDNKTVIKNTQKLDELFASSLEYLAKRNYASATSTLTTLKKQIADEKTKASSSVDFSSVAIANIPPSSGYRRQSVQTDIGTFTLDIVSADLSSTRVIVDTASESDCTNDCAVLPLSDYVSRNGGYAGINGSYFCPASYPSCQGKTNSFDTLLMNKNKKYFNSDNNVYSTVPAVIFLGTSVRFVPQSLQWGRDTGVDSVIANQPMLLHDKKIVFGGDGDPKKGGKGSRSFVASSGNTVYIGVVHNATVAEVAHALQGLGMENAINLDSGGSTALWSGGYKVGPGRNIPNAIIFVKR